jgi:hypothetical protein
MKHRKRGAADGHVNTEGWMMSYADMATTLLAMFIVLSTMGKDQTGVSLYNGTGSFFHALDTLGLGGNFTSSARSIQFDSYGPKYQLKGEGGARSKKLTPEEQQRIIDAENNRMQRFLNEFERQFRVDKLPHVIGQASIDIYDSFDSKPPYLTAKQYDVITGIQTVFRESNYRVFLIVWAPTPTESAWTRAATEARVAVQNIAETLELSQGARERLLPFAQTWRYVDVRRPVMTLLIARTD